jgi:hypothetical protein
VAAVVYAWRDLVEHELAVDVEQLKCECANVSELVGYRHRSLDCQRLQWIIGCDDGSTRGVKDPRVVDIFGQRIDDA